MTELAWDQIGKRFYENGLDRGVLYLQDRTGVAWNGLISIQEKTTNTATPLFYDGVKFNDDVKPGVFSGTLKAFTYPDEFLQFEGVSEDEAGVLLTDQPQPRFHLSYRTKVGNDLQGNDLGYKIHLLYNLLAVPKERSRDTLSLDGEAIEFEWDISAVPEHVQGYRPTAHLVLDSRKIDPLLLADIEAILYGDDETPAQIPPMSSLMAFIRKWDRLIIIDNGDGTWTATTSIPGYISMIDETTFQIDNANATYLDEDTYEISSTPKNLEDI